MDQGTAVGTTGETPRQLHATPLNGGSPRTGVAPQVGKPAHGTGSATRCLLDVRRIANSL